MANAFNSIDRAALLRAVYGNAELAACWRMVSFGYSHSSLLLMPCGDEVSEADAFLESSNGGSDTPLRFFCMFLPYVPVRVSCMFLLCVPVSVPHVLHRCSPRFCFSMRRC